MKNLAAMIVMSMLPLGLFVTAGCVASDPGESDALVDDGPSTELAVPDDGREWVEVSPGILISDDGTTRQWIIQGEEAHAAFREEIEGRLRLESDAEATEFYDRVLADIDDARESGGLQKPGPVTSALNYSTSITEVPGGLKAYAHADRGSGYVHAHVTVNINGNSATDSKSKSDTCISKCSVTVEKQVSSCPSAPTSCYAMAFAQAAGSSSFVERDTCPSMPCVTCCPRTYCYSDECGYVADGCGGALYCGQCSGGCDGSIVYCE